MKRTDKHPTTEQLNTFVQRLCSEEQYDEEEGRWTFRGGGDCLRCSDAASRIAKHFGGEVVGYWSKLNKRALIGTNHGDGHDFALISKRFIVDYWAYRVARLISAPVLDLQRPRHRQLADALYGDHEAWDVVSRHTSK